MGHSTNVVLAALALFVASCSSNTGEFFLINKAGEPIASASVVICGQLIELKGVERNKTVGGSYKVTADSHYTIQVEFESGRMLKKEAGYVTRGMDFRHEIVVTDSDIEIADTKVK